MLELNGRKEAAIFKLIGEESEGGYYNAVNAGANTLPEVHYSKIWPILYKEDKYSENERYLKHFSYALRKFKELEAGVISPWDILDFESNARAFILAKAWGSGHTIGANNSRFYINPYTLRVEPILTDQTRYERISENPAYSPMIENLFGEPVYKEDFVPYARNFIERMRETLPLLSEHQNELCRPFPLDCPDFHPNILRQNVDWIEEVALPAWEQAPLTRTSDKFNERTTFDPMQPGPGVVEDPGTDTGTIYSEHLRLEHYEGGALRIYNLLPKPVRVKSIEIECTKRAPDHCNPKNIPIKNSFLPGSLESRKLHYRTWDTGVRDLTRARKVRVISERNGQIIESTTPLSIRPAPRNPLLWNRDGFTEMVKPEWLTVSDGVAFIGPGDVRVEAPLILPNDMPLSIAPGTTLTFAEGTYIIVRAALVAKGLPSERIVLKGEQGDRWKGLYVLEAEKRSILRNVEIADTTFFVDGALDLTGSVTFYKADVDISDTLFTRSIAEDALNIVQSEFSIERTTFHTIRSDAFDSDFSAGAVKQSDFITIGGDGVDFAGSQATLQDLSFKSIGDKAISVGEASMVIGQGIAVQDADLAVVSKDGSVSRISGLTMNEESRVVAMAYNKKSFYGAAQIELNDTSLTTDQVKIQTGNSGLMDGRELPSESVDVEALYDRETAKIIGTVQ
jgi:hypothetical protein